MEVGDTFKQFRRTNIAEMRPYIKGESLDNISVSNVDDPESDMGMDVVIVHSVVKYLHEIKKMILTNILMCLL